MSEPNLPTGAAEPKAHRDCACTLFAVVDANGELVRKCNALDSQRRDDGIYAVRFNRDVSGCAYVATIGLPGIGNPPPGEISVAGFNQPDVVIVRTFTSVGAPADLPFHLAVHCCCPEEDEG